MLILGPVRISDSISRPYTAVLKKRRCDTDFQTVEHISGSNIVPILYPTMTQTLTPLEFRHFRFLQVVAVNTAHTYKTYMTTGMSSSSLLDRVTHTHIYDAWRNFALASTGSQNHHGLSTFWAQSHGTGVGGY